MTDNETTEVTDTPEDAVANQQSTTEDPPELSEPETPTDEEPTHSESAEESESSDGDEPEPADELKPTETFDLTVQTDDQESDEEPIDEESSTQAEDGDPEHSEEADEPGESVEEFPKNWYIVKVTSGRETSIKAAIERRVKIEGLEEFFGQVYIPVEKVIEVRKIKETRNGEKVTRERRVTKAKKKFPGYVMAEVHYNDEIQFLFRETAGVGDFVGSSPGHAPQPMKEIDVRRMLGELSVDEDAGSKKKVKVKLDFEKDDKVRIREGAFANMEGEVKEISEPKDASETPKITVIVPIFGRPVEVVLDYWQVDKV